MLNVKMNHLRCWALLNESRDELSSIQNVGTCLTCLACGLALDLDHVSWKLTCKRHVTRLCSPHSPLEMERFAAGYDWLNSNFAHRFFEQQMFTDNEQCVIGVSSIGVFSCTAREIFFLPAYKSVLAYMAAIVSRDSLILVWMLTRFWPVKWKEH